LAPNICSSLPLPRDFTGACAPALATPPLLPRTCRGVEARHPRSGKTCQGLCPDTSRTQNARRLTNVLALNQSIEIASLSGAPGRIRTSDPQIRKVRMGFSYGRLSPGLALVNVGLTLQSGPFLARPPQLRPVSAGLGPVLRCLLAVSWGSVPGVTAVTGKSGGR
jgi:hypothetical protein